MLTSLIFILACLGVLVGMVSIVTAIIWRKWKSVLKISLLLGLGLICYFAIMLIVSLTSPQNTLALNQEHCFDEICFSVVGVDKVKTITGSSSPATAQGTFYLVQLQLRNAALRVAQKPDSPAFKIVDTQGHTYNYSKIELASSTNVQTQTDTTDLFTTTKLNPGEKSVRTLVFDLPNTVTGPCLVISEGGWPTSLIIGDENSFFHKKTQVCFN
jgi:hypothetical protein